MLSEDNLMFFVVALIIIVVVYYVYEQNKDNAKDSAYYLKKVYLKQLADNKIQIDDDNSYHIYDQNIKNVRKGDLLHVSGTINLYSGFKGQNILQLVYNSSDTQSKSRIVYSEYNIIAPIDFWFEISEDMDIYNVYVEVNYKSIDGNNDFVTIIGQQISLEHYTTH